MIKTDSGLGKTIFLLFLLPFCAVGIFTGVLAVQKMTEGDWKQGGFLLIFALAFGGAGFGTVAALLFGSRAVKREEELRELNPSAPWRWRQDWVEGRVKGGAKPRLVMAWIFAFFWNVVSLPLVFFLPSEVIEKENYAALLGLLFPLVGFGAIVYAVHASLEWQRYRETVFQMSSVPGVIGGDLSGSILLNTEVNPADGFDMTLSCVRRIRSGSGKSRSTSETILWQEELKRISPMPRGDAPGCSVPVHFRLPYECRASDPANPDDRILWMLEARASLPGVDFDDRFEVPVFKTERSSPKSTEEQIRLEEQSREEANGRPSVSSGIDVRPSPLGGTEFVFARARNPGAAASLGVFFVIWTTITAGLFLVDAPLIFPLVFGGFDLLFVVVLAQLLLAQTWIVVESGTVAVRTSLLGVMSGKRARCDEIKSVGLNISAQTNRRPYYNIVLTRHTGPDIDVWTLIADKRQAEWVVDEIEKAIRRWRPMIPAS